MDDQERDRLIQAKTEISEWLAGEDLNQYNLGTVDPRLAKYCRDVSSDPKGHNLWEQLAVRRFLKNITTYGLSRKKVRAFYSFYEQLYFPGKRGLTRYKLTPVQCFQFASIYGFWHNGRRVVREVVLFVPRKFSKTTSIAAIALFDLLFGESNAECYYAANSADQAKKGFDVLRGCMRKLDPRQLYYTINEREIKSHRPDRTAFAQSLTSNAQTKDGLNASTTIMDEFSQARDANLLSVLTTSMGVRDNPLTVIITTASDVFDGPFYSMLQGYKSVLLGDVEDDSLFAHLFEPDIDDAEDDPKTWKKVHPHIGVTVNEDFYAQEYLRAQRNGAEAILAFRTKLLNVYAENQMRAWISASDIREHMAPINLRSYHGEPAMLSFDLSVRDDFSAVSVGICRDERRGLYDFHTAYFFPEGALVGHPNEKLYRSWAADGWLRLLPGEVIDYDAIAEYILEINKYVQILSIGYDGWKAKNLVNTLGAAITGLHGVPKNVLHEIPQTYGYFTAPVQVFEHGLRTGLIRIDQNPINAYCFGNAVLDFGTLENCKPVKRSQNKKIDGVITTLMCVRRFLDFER